MGRPRKRLPKDGFEIIRDCAARGVGEVDLAKALGMSFPTWKKLRDEDEDVREVYEEAKSIERDKLVGVLYEAATNDGNTGAAMFLLKARHGYRDHGPTDGAEAGVNINLTLPPALDPDQYSRLVQQSHKALEGAHG